MKKQIFLSIFLTLLFNSCVKSKNNSNIKTDYLKNQNKVENSEQILNKTDFDSNKDSVQNEKFSKIDSVYSKMSQRFKSEIKNLKSEEFLTDLEKVLQEEKSFNQNDLEILYLIDKKNTISENYIPKDLVLLKKNDLFNISKNNLYLRPDVKNGLEELSKAALKDGIKLTVSSTYRSYEYQKNLFDYWVKVDGLEEAERESARPGTSQHQLGSAIDFGNIDDSFINTEEGKWLNKNSQKYGWSLSFPHEYEEITGYRWECWHFRFIGKSACELQKKYFNNVQQFMLEFIDLWKQTN